VAAGLKGSHAERHWIPAGTVSGIRTGLEVARGAWRCIKGQPLLYPEFGSQTIEADDIRLVRHALSNPASWDDTDAVEQFEREFARWNGSLSAFGFMGGRVALSACIHALGLRPGDEAVLPGYTCIVVPNAFSYAGVKVRYCDIELDTYGPDFDSLRSAITSKTKVLIVQHLYGLVARDFEKILDFAADRRISVIEDCAHASGAWRRF
jgi:dTDP-4-amino-4,6-dideoxygalactose transaminase